MKKIYFDIVDYFCLLT